MFLKALLVELLMYLVALVYPVVLLYELVVYKLVVLPQTGMKYILFLNGIIGTNQEINNQIHVESRPQMRSFLISI